ncbi:MAG: glycosyltransferase family 2 protein [Bacteroidaceae bacterium]|nr:glycosyltransferase family 2 protein [Bacteroidaceae bacterium]
MSKVSVLIAVYNAEKYLEQCLESVCSQSLRDIQIVCVNDCSTDSSAEILDRYAKTDKRITVIHLLENSGQAVARNEGLKIADGEFVMMLDSDDWLEYDAIEKAYRAITAEEDIDCCLLDLILYYQDEERMEAFNNRTEKTLLTGEEAFKLSLFWNIHGLYLIRASIHKAHPYDTSCRLFSDDNTTHIHYLYSRKVVFSKGRYYYRKHSASMTTAMTIRRFDYLEAILNMKRTLEIEIGKGRISEPEKILNKYETYRWLNIVDAYWVYYSNRTLFTEQECKEIESRIADKLKTVERFRIPLSLKIKLGYYPFRSYKVFSFVEDFYFRLRKLIGH